MAMTVYEYFQRNAIFNRECAKEAKSKAMLDHFLSDADRWEARARTVTPEEGGKPFDDVLLWRLINEVDMRNVIHA